VVKEMNRDAVTLSLSPPLKQEVEQTCGNEDGGKLEQNLKGLELTANRPTENEITTTRTEATESIPDEAENTITPRNEVNAKNEELSAENKSGNADDELPKSSAAATSPTPAASATGRQRQQGRKPWEDRRNKGRNSKNTSSNNKRSAEDHADSDNKGTNNTEQGPEPAPGTESEGNRGGRGGRNTRSHNNGNMNNNRKDPLVLECPHCGGSIVILAIKCAIFRHGTFKKNGRQIPPHTKKELCEEYVAKDMIWGCGKPFRIVNQSEAVACDYI
jgi:hypothetical protein